ncbi:Gustatory and odorant receptor 22 [Plutella xylostella]|uniref:Gustatory and odorant receptor 22 n=1 Tax=Plutella xylostella TaxID=51655 RepID=A0ABQ7Q0L3_PLUXY|nr:Gustatory and odorant receptor 22 [Plutella xylostella]
MYGIYCMVIFFTTTISLYGALSEILEHGLSYKEMGLFVIVGYCMTLLFIICNEAFHATRKVRPTLTYSQMTEPTYYLVNSNTTESIHSGN